MLVPTLFLLALATLDVGAGQVPRPRPKETDGNKLVQVALLADTDGVKAGSTFQIGIQLEMKRGWHVYWENPGDSGIPTTAELEGPDGFEIGRVRFPCPTRHEEEGDIVSYIHEGTVLLLADVRAPAKLESGAKLEFRVACDWLVCTDYCLPGSGKAALVLAAAAEPKVANEAVFAKGSAAHPKPWKDVLGTAEPVFEALPDERSRVVIEVPEAKELEFFPEANDSTKLVKRTVTRTEKGARIELLFEQINASKDVDYRGVLWIQDPKRSQSCIQDRWRPAKT